LPLGCSNARSAEGELESRLCYARLTRRCRPNRRTCERDGQTKNAQIEIPVTEDRPSPWHIRLPSPDTLRALVDAGAVEEGAREETVLSLVQTVDIHDEASMHSWRDDSSEESCEVKRVVLRAIAVAVLLLGGWFIFSQVLPATIKQAFQPLATPRLRAAPTLPKSVAVMRARIPASPVDAGPTAAELATQRQQAMQIANALQKKKDLAWAAFYTAPTSCEHPADWSAQVECGNQYMRAKKLFEQKWEAEVVLNNASVAGPHK
jgi:hypothetical protein